MTNTKTIAGVKVTDKFYTRFNIGRVVFVIALNAVVMANGGWSQAFQGSVQNDAAQVTHVAR